MNRQDRIREASKIRKSLYNASAYIAKKESQSRWVWNDMHKRVHDNQYRLLAILSESENEIKNLRAEALLKEGKG